jgi:hypothetical protein
MDALLAHRFRVFTNSTLIRKKAMPIAIINVDMSRVSIIFCTFAGAKLSI